MCFSVFSGDISEESDDEMSDSEIDRLVIVTQKYRSDKEGFSTSPGGSSHGHAHPHGHGHAAVMQPSSRPLKHEGYDRTGNWTTRTKMTQELAQIINDGLKYYEEDYMAESETSHTPKQASFSTINVISKEDFEKLAPPTPRAVNPEFPPPPPVPCNTPLNPSVLQEVCCRFYIVKLKKDVFLIPSIHSIQVGGESSGSSKSRSKTRSRRRTTRFYPAGKEDESKDGEAQEHHVGWIREGKRRRSRTVSVK